MGTRGDLTRRESIVIAVVAGLFLAMMAPSFFQRAQDKGGGPRCQSNLKQLGLAVHMYASDNDERLPPYAYRWAGGVTRWESALWPYHRTWRLYHCDWQFDDPNWSWQSGTPVPASLFGYGANRDYLFPPQTIALSDVKQPAATIMLADRDMFGRDLRAPIAGRGALMDPPCNVALRHDERGTAPRQGNRHKDGANFLFADGHVKWMKAGDVWSKDDTLWDLK